jgi:hypothetical protein
MRVPRVLGTGRFSRDLEHQLNSQRWAIDPINVTVWGLMAATVPANWVGLIWGIMALINDYTVS